jgi:dipeptidyl aminopeptidase/acylaminoacyl peptidase
VRRRGLFAIGALVVATGCGGTASKQELGKIPDVSTSAEPEWLPFAIRAGNAVPGDAREKHLTELRELPATGDVTRVRWSDDGRSLFFVVGKEISSLNLGSGVVTRLEGDPATRAFPNLDGLDGILVHAPDKSTEMAMGPEGSPDRSRIAWVKRSKKDGPLYVASVFGTPPEAKNVLAIAPDATRTPSFLPDSHRVAFACDVDDPDFQIYVVDLDAARTDGGMPRRVRVTFAEGGSEAPAFSPDGKHVAFVSRRSDHRAPAPRHLYVARWLEDP